MSELETVLLFQREHSSQVEQWVAPHNDVRMYADRGGVTVEPKNETGQLLYLAHIVEAHLITRPKPVQLSD